MSTPTPPLHGYGVPTGFGAVPPSEPAHPADDPLVPPPGSGLRGWRRAFGGTLRRSFFSLLLVMLAAVPLYRVLQLLIDIGFLAGWTAGTSTLGGVDERVWLVRALLGSVLPVLATLAVNAVAWGTAIALVTQRAAGAPVGVGTALGVGLRRAPAMFGWLLLWFAPAVALSLVALLSYHPFGGNPGPSGAALVGLAPLLLYLAFAGALFSFPVIYERGRVALLRSFALVHRSYGAALARVLPLVVGFLVIAGGIELVSMQLRTVVGPGPAGVAGYFGVWLVDTGLRAAVLAPLHAVLVVGLLVSYAQLRARRESISTGRLWVAARG